MFGLMALRSGSLLRGNGLLPQEAESCRSKTWVIEIYLDDAGWQCGLLKNQILATWAGMRFGVWRGFGIRAGRVVLHQRFQADEPSVASRRSMLSRAANFRLFGTNPTARSFIHARLTFSRMSLAFAVQRYGVGLRLCSSIYSRIACCNSATS